MNDITIRSRIVKYNNYIIATNYKVAFSTINKNEIFTQIPEETFKPDNYKNYKRVFLCRCPIKRIISLFLNCIYERKLRGSIILTLVQEYDPNIYKNIIAADKEKGFAIFVNILPHIYLKNEHMHPQTYLLKRFDSSEFYLLDIDNPADMKMFQSICDYNIEIFNASDVKDKECLNNYVKNNREIANKILALYAGDHKLWMRC